MVTTVLRRILVVIHRYVGLATAIFLAIAGLTGSLLAFTHEIDEWLNPDLYTAPGRGPILSPAQIAAHVEATDARLRVWYISLKHEPGHASVVVGMPRVDPQSGKPYELDYNWLFVDPVTGAVIGKRKWGECCFERQNFIPFIYEFHHNLKLPEPWGVLLMGVVAIFWVVDCVVAVVLTFPRARPFFAKWGAAWTVKAGSAYRFNFDLHRAGGLWLWIVLLLVAISSVAMNLRKEVFEPVVSTLSTITPSPFDRRPMQPPEKPIETNLTYDDILARALAEAQRRGWTLPPGEIFYSPAYGLFGVGFGEHDSDNVGNPWLYFEAEKGTFFGEIIPGEGSAGDVFVQLQYPIHGGRIAGLPGRIVIAIAGLGIAMLSVTGIVIWWRKLIARRRQRRSAQFPGSSTQPGSLPQPHMRG